MPRKYLKKGSKSKGRRRLGGAGSGRKRVGAVTGAVLDLAPRVREGIQRFGARLRGKRFYSNARRSQMRGENLSAGDNIVVLPTTVIGTPRKLSFKEKVARVERPPILFKRNYQFSAECLGGRKAWFNINLNHYSNDIQQDTATYKQNLTTDTINIDDTVTGPDVYDKGRFYVDYMNTKLQLMNSGSNALVGKLHLFAYKRDCRSQYNSTPINPVNMMMYYSAYGRPLSLTNQEAIMGNGWNFDTSTANYNFNANYNMPGSSVNSSGTCAFTDLALSPSSTHIKQDIGFWFKPVSVQTFNLKPGQQCNKVIKFHDLPTIAREQLDLEFISGVSYAIAVEFQGQVVGAIDTANLVSTGSAQLSVIREDIRILGLKNGLKPKVMLQTSPLTTILKANQVIINPDTGVQLNGFVDDA